MCDLIFKKGYFPASQTLTFNGSPFHHFAHEVKSITFSIYEELLLNLDLNTVIHCVPAQNGGMMRKIFDQNYEN